MNDFARGVVYWAHLDKRRPVVVVSHPFRNPLARDVVGVPCSTRARPMSWHVTLQAGEGGLPALTRVRCEQVTTISKSDLEPEPLGRPLSPVRMREIERAILSALAISPP